MSQSEFSMTVNKKCHQMSTNRKKEGKNASNAAAGSTSGRKEVTEQEEKEKQEAREDEKGEATEEEKKEAREDEKGESAAHQRGKIAKYTFTYYILTTLLSSIIGAVLVMSIAPGSSLHVVQSSSSNDVGIIYIHTYIYIYI